VGLNKELDGIIVISLEQAVAAPYCGLLLADAGARVIKVERPEGDFARSYDNGAEGKSTIFGWLNRGKESICLNLKEVADMELMRDALQHADIFVSNLAPGAVSRMGLDGVRLRENNPGLITCSISGYGEEGESSKKKAYDFLIQAESGVCSVTGTPESPSRVGIPLTDLSTGITAFSAILRALIQRGRTAVGVDLKIAMFDVMADWMNMPLLAHRYMGGAPERSALKHSFIAPYGAFTCSDGGQVLLSVQSNREFDALCSYVLDRPDLPKDDRFLDNPARYMHRQALNAIVSVCFSEWKTSEVLGKLEAAKIANAQLNSVASLSSHPNLRNVQAVWGEQKIDMAALPVHTDFNCSTEVPELDQHGPALRAEFKVRSRKKDDE
jgi:formyl-CoA transferase